MTFHIASLPDQLGVALAVAADRLGGFRGRVLWYAEVDSTNDLAMSFAEQDGSEGTVVVADAQLRGRGRRGRSWFSPPGAGIYASVVLRPADAALGLLPLAAGLAVAEGIEAATGLSTGVKWPNDVFVPGPGGVRRKLAGVLVDASGADTGAARAVVGFGVNVLRSMFPPDVADKGTTIETELGRPIDRGLILAECLASLWARYGHLHEGRLQAVADAWRRRASASLGRPVEWNEGEQVRTGEAVDIDDAGALLVRTPSGIARIVSAEVRWR